MLLVSSAFAAPPKKKKPKPDATEKAKDKDKDAGGEIEMDNPDATPAPAPTPAASPPATEAEPPPVAPPPPSSFPLQIDDRPLTLPKGKVEVHGGLPITVLPFIDNAGNRTTSTIVGLNIGGTYGIDDKTEIGADYTFGLSPGDASGLFAIHGAYLVLHDAKMDLAIAGALEVQPVGTFDSTGVAITQTMFALQLGAWFRYHIKPKISLFSGVPALPYSGVSLSRQGIALPPVGYQLDLGLNNGGAIALELPIGVGYQATPNIYAFVATNLANIKISNVPNQFLFADFIPFSIGGFYSMPKLDVGAEFADDLKQAGDYLTFLIVGRYYVK